MASLPAIRADVTRYFGAKPLWLTEYGYQTNPPDRLLGVSYALQARYLSDAALRVWRQPGVTLLIHFLVRDEPSLGGWQSGLFSVGGAAKLAYHAFALPLAEVSRRGSSTVLWGQVRPGSGARAYVLQRSVGGRWRAVGGTAATSRSGTFTRTATLPAGARVRIFAPAVGWASPPLRLVGIGARGLPAWTPLFASCICSPRPCGSAARSRSSSSPCRRCSGSRARRGAAAARVRTALAPDRLDVARRSRS